MTRDDSLLIAAAFRSLHHPLPWCACADDAGVIVDANGAPVLVIDFYRDRGDADVMWLRLLVIESVNTLGGVQKEIDARCLSGIAASAR